MFIIQNDLISNITLTHKCNRTQYGQLLDEHYNYKTLYTLHITT
jgi:hypothetical protein